MGPAGGSRPAEELEPALGLEFRDQGLLRQALTHRSWVNETGGDDVDSYERLEFLGDVVLRLIVSEELYHRLPDTDEGGLTRRLGVTVSQQTLAAVARRLDVEPYVLVGRGVRSSGDRHGDGVLGDVMESLIAAVYLDAGYDATRRFVLSVLSVEIEATCRTDWRPDNPKAELQELLQAQGKPTPVYQVVDASGPAHQPQFTVQVEADGKSIGVGSGRSKSSAETEAARSALAALADSHSAE